MYPDERKQYGRSKTLRLLYNVMNMKSFSDFCTSESFYLLLSGFNVNFRSKHLHLKKKTSFDQKVLELNLFSF